MGLLKVDLSSNAMRIYYMYVCILHYELYKILRNACVQAFLPYSFLNYSSIRY